MSSFLIPSGSFESVLSHVYYNLSLVSRELFNVPCRFHDEASLCTFCLHHTLQKCSCRWRIALVVWMDRKRGEGIWPRSVILCPRSDLSSWHPVWDFLLPIQAQYVLGENFLPLFLIPLHSCSLSFFWQFHYPACQLFLLLGCYLKCLSVLTSRPCKTLPHSLSKIQPFLSIHATEILVQGLSCHLTSQAKAAFLTLIHSE